MCCAGGGGTVGSKGREPFLAQKKKGKKMSKTHGLESSFPSLVGYLCFCIFGPRTFFFLPLHTRLELVCLWLRKYQPTLIWFNSFFFAGNFFFYSTTMSLLSLKEASVRGLCEG
ncbi:hypothetical protein J3E72DRAFT_38152 [Bipolaris maydis]|uniref:uncharacterized protein n=1 Tax=Cochliobolus heterostrophus TaxID=5016 RepID=UPI0024CECE22|nr:hypothetical protein J3E73DRAFT_38447 [Bipolaris maydis]KAJ5062954.1 hypothetical protein J3E74DRAFT_34683 [Bipolaris maydis]KAJ6199224.1 hypothetical protein J3E72DRAFT_38152 [Bipolaris maydis]KAJ6203920.1 hypothetical protein PSV09DRAFT_2018671 [Bipolaris maydis]KAJ6265557.1 hypothetical protein PSV08DRAFT_21659 [Bipolaris maydis]